MGVFAAGRFADAAQALIATSPFVSGASMRMTSQASMSVSIFGKPLAAPSRCTPFNAPSASTSCSVSQAMPLPPLPTFVINGPSAVNWA